MATYLTSDHHFGHANIIEYGDRPFATLSGMEWGLVDRWNEVVDDGDIVYHLGDMCYQDHTHHSYWLNDGDDAHLNGQVILIRGNHDYFNNWDDDISLPVLEDATIRAPNGVELYLRHHDEPWDGRGPWLVHGHVHDEKPALLRQQKKVNVSVEVSDYRPVALREIAEEIYSGEGDRAEW